MRIDSHRPTTKALAAASVKHGKTAALKYKVVDALPGSEYADATIKVTNKRHKVVARVVAGEVASNKAQTAKFKCTLAPGTYTFAVYATDLAGNTQSKAGSATLVVK